MFVTAIFFRERKEQKMNVMSKLLYIFSMVFFPLQPGTRERDSKVACPFCKKEPYVVKFCGALSESEKKKIQIEEQKTREAQIRMRNEETQRDIEREELRRSQTSDRSDDEERVTPGLDVLSIAHGSSFTAYLLKACW